MVEIEGYYIVFQVKERADFAEENKDISWFNDTVKNIAKKQIKSSIKYIKGYNYIYKDKNGKIIELDKSKQIIPVIVFSNSRIKNYQRRVKSNDLKTFINIFEVADFETMMNILIMPIDIIYYFEYRTMIGNSTMLFHDIDEENTMFGRIKSEEDCAYFYLGRRYYLNNPYLENVQYFKNVIISFLENNYEEEVYEFFSTLNYQQADGIASNVKILIEHSKNDYLDKSFKVILDDIGYYFVGVAKSFNKMQIETIIDLNMIWSFATMDLDFIYSFIIQFSDTSIEVDYCITTYILSRAEIPEEHIKSQITFYKSKLKDLVVFYGYNKDSLKKEYV